LFTLDEAACLLLLPMMVGLGIRLTVKRGYLMPVSGVVVSCLAGCAEAVSSRISAFDGVEVHGVLPDGRIIAVIEADTVDAEVGLVSQLHEVEDVVAVQLAYHNFEDL
jgi:nitrate reductase NapD